MCPDIITFKLNLNPILGVECLECVCVVIGQVLEDDLFWTIDHFPSQPVPVVLDFIPKSLSFNVYI